MSQDGESTNTGEEPTGLPPFRAVAVRRDSSAVGSAATESSAAAGTGSGAAARHVLGDPHAEICIVEFGDYECPYCAGTTEVLHEVVTSSAGRVCLVFQNFPLFEIHPFALTAALAAESAQATGGTEVFWKMHRRLLRNQNRLTDHDLRTYAQESGADPDRAVGAAAQEYAPLVQADYAAGVASGVSGTPTLFIDGVPYTGVVDVASIRRACEGRIPATRRRRFPGLTRPASSRTRQ